ncbi:MAG: hypothetical protein DMG70_15385 [Acidobacteria bacterium]|nr:MAG: hypothetical protein DMG70_15385 [Acidobacteriota bacterium]
MIRCLLFTLSVLFEMATFGPEPGGASNPQTRIQVVDVDSESSLEQVSVTLRPLGSNTELRFRTTDGRGVANFGTPPAGDYEVEACRPDHIPSDWKRWNELTESDQVTGTKVLKLKRSTTRQNCMYGDQRHRRHAGSRAAIAR